MAKRKSKNDVDPVDNDALFREMQEELQLLRERNARLQRERSVLITQDLHDFTDALINEFAKIISELPPSAWPEIVYQAIENVITKYGESYRREAALFVKLACATFNESTIARTYSFKDNGYGSYAPNGDYIPPGGQGVEYPPALAEGLEAAVQAEPGDDPSEGQPGEDAPADAAPVALSEADQVAMAHEVR